MTLSGNPVQNRLDRTSFGSSGQEHVSLNADYRLNSSWHVYGGLNYTHFNYTGGALNSPLARILNYTEPPSLPPTSLACNWALPAVSEDDVSRVGVHAAHPAWV